MILNRSRLARRVESFGKYVNNLDLIYVYYFITEFPRNMLKMYVYLFGKGRINWLRICLVYQKKTNYVSGKPILK